MDILSSSPHCGATANHGLTKAALLQKRQMMLPAVSSVEDWAESPGNDIKLAQHDAGAAIAHETAGVNDLLRSG